MQSWDLWEERRGIHTFTVSATIGALQAAAAFARDFGEQDRAAAYREGAERMKGALRRHMWHPERRMFARMAVPLDDGTYRRLPPAQVFHLHGLGFDGLVGYSPVRMAARSIGLGIAQDTFGQAFYGNGTTFDLSAFREGDAVDADSKRYAAFISDLTAWIGLQCVNKYAVGRLKDATADSGKGVTDAKIAELLSKFPVGERPSHLLMSRRSAFQLQVSRTTAPNTKQEAFAGILPGVPTESFGIPIIITDSIGDTETLS
jgi:hypothetical protein